MTTVAPPQKSRLSATSRSKCRLCGLAAERAGPLCGGCAYRLELELELDPSRACPNCGRHPELCAVIPCAGQASVLAQRGGRTDITWISVSDIDEPGPELNSRSTYPDASIAQLAASIRDNGVLQPLCVRANRGRYQLVFGVRRYRAAIRAGMREVPCTIQVADDDRAFLLNTLENLHREQLSGAERIRAIERLAATGLGVREISRRTGFNPSTISRWLRIDACAELKSAVEEGRLDIGRAKILVEAPRPRLGELIKEAPGLSAAELRGRVAAIKSAPTVAADDAARRLREALRNLRAVQRTADRDLLELIRREVERLSDGLPRRAV